MSFDISRSTFRPRKNFLGVVMQQGRVQLDSDWNEWQSEYSRRIQAGTLDTLGRAVYPSSTPNAFQITASTNANGTNTLTIGAGRYYVDGLLVENHGPKTDSTWDTALAELSGAPCDVDTTVTTDFTQQPYYPGATIPGNGPYLAYLDVWQRDVTYLEDPYLIDKAVGIDTTGRLQTVWQVKLLDLSNFPGGATCTTDIPAWNQPPAAQLTNGLIPNAASGPCCLTPNTGYTGQENQLYRVEIHQPGTPAAAPLAGGFTYPLPANTPTFKWSRDNASVATSVSAISAVTTSSGSVSQITVASLGRDQVLGFAVNDWIEITDDVYELNGQPGELYQITGVTAASLTITLNGTVSSHFPLTGGQTTPKLHTRIRRWDQGGTDQSGNVYQTDSSGNTTLWINLNAIGSTGDIPIPPQETLLVLENGITVTFNLSPATFNSTPTIFNSGDYWNFAARTADGSIEPLTAAPPAGIHHHYARLSIVSFPGTPTDCRTEWPHSESGSCCTCTVNVTPSDITADNTLQNIFDKYQNLSTPTTICLTTGTYLLPTPLRLTPAHTGITLEACQPGGVYIQAQKGNESQFTDGLIVLDNVEAITFTGIDFLVPVATFSGTTFAGLPLSSLSPDVSSMLEGLLVSIGIRIVNSSEITIVNCAFSLGYSTEEYHQESSAILAAGIFVSGQNDGFRIESNQFIPESAKLLHLQESFFTGFLLASTVSFISSTPAPPTNLQAANETAIRDVAGAVPATPAAPAAPTAAKNSKVKKAQVKEVSIAPRVTELPAVDFTETDLAKEVISDTGLQYVGGQLQNLGGFRPSFVSTLASQGGTVLAATLDDSVFRDNTFTRMTVAALLLGEPGNIDLLANQVEVCRAGFWLVAPSQAQNLLLDPQGLTMLGATVALGYPLPQGDTGADTVTVAAVPSSVRIYTGTTNYIDSNKNLWLPDITATSVTTTGGTLFNPIPPPTITGTSDQPLYQSERFGPTFSYTFDNLPTGYYSLTLKFAEIAYTNNQANKGVRIFDVSVNGEQVLTNFDIVADAGGADIADDYTFSGIVPNAAGQIVVQFTGTTNGIDHNAKISAAELDPLWTGAPYLGSGNESDAASFFDQLAQLAWQGYANLGFSLAQLRVEDNEMHYLSAPGLLLLDDDGLANGDSGSLMMTGNRIDGEIQASEFNFAESANPVEYLRASSGALLTASAPALRAFTFLAVIVQVSRCVVTSNMLTNGNPTDGYGPSLYLNDIPVQQAEIAVMSNVFAGGTVIRPFRNLTNSNVDPILLTWNFLNTIITG
jgi:hypothetical protein